MILVALVAASCASAPSQTRETIAAYGVAIAATDRVATAYVVKPQCTGKNGPDGVNCSEKVTVDEVKHAGQRAHDDYVAARKAEDAGATPDVAAIKTSLAAFGAALPPAAR